MNLIRQNARCAHIPWVKSSENDLNLLYYQYEGYSSRGLQPEGSSGNWRCNRISDIATAKIINAAWRQPIQNLKHAVIAWGCSMSKSRTSTTEIAHTA